MLGEIAVLIESAEEKLQQLFDEKENFIQKNEGRMLRLEYYKELDRIDSRIDEAKTNLLALQKEEQDILSSRDCHLNCVTTKKRINFVTT